MTKRRGNGDTLATCAAVVIAILLIAGAAVLWLTGML